MTRLFSVWMKSFDLYSFELAIVWIILKLKQTFEYGIPPRLRQFIWFKVSFSFHIFLISFNFWFAKKLSFHESFDLEFPSAIESITVEICKTKLFESIANKWRSLFDFVSIHFSFENLINLIKLLRALLVTLNQNCTFLKEWFPMIKWVAGK